MFVCLHTRTITIHVVYRHRDTGFNGDFTCRFEWQSHMTLNVISEMLHLRHLTLALAFQ